jgi:hypothetical protein
MAATALAQAEADVLRQFEIEYDKNNYQAAALANTETAYRDYLDNCQPICAFRETALERYLVLVTAVNRREDYQEFFKYCQKDQCAAYPAAQQAFATYESLEKTEQALFSRAEKSNKAAGYRAYLAACELCAQGEAAEARLQALEPPEDWSQWKLDTPIKFDKQITALAIDPTGKRLLVGFYKRYDNNSSMLLDMPSRRVLHFYEATKNTLAADFSGDGQMLAISSEDRKDIRIFRTFDSQWLHSFSTSNSYAYPYSLSFSHDSLLLAAGDYRDESYLYQVNDLTTRFTFKNQAAQQLAFSPDDSRLAIVFGRYARIYSTADGKLLATLPYQSADLKSLAFSPDGKFLATAGDAGDIKLWDAKTYEWINTLSPHATIHTASIVGLFFSPDSQQLISASADKTIRIWSVNDGKLLNTLQAHEEAITKLAMTPDGSLLLSGDASGLINVWTRP